MMIKKALTALAILLSCSMLCAQEKGSVRLVGGLEWGYAATILNSYHYNYTDPAEGYRVDKRENDIILNSNGCGYARMGVEMFKHYTATLNVGWAGIKQTRRVMPVFIRESYNFKECNQDGAFVYASQGIALHDKESYVSMMAQLGGGYRIALSSRNFLDLMLGVQLCNDSPTIYDKENGSYIPQENIRESKATYGAVNLTIAIGF